MSAIIEAYHLGGATVKQVRYSKEFKLQAVKRVIEDGVTQTQAAKELGINIETMRSWIHAYRENREEPFVGSGQLHQEDRRIKDLERRVKDLEEENEILKKAAAIFARERRK